MTGTSPNGDTPSEGNGSQPIASPTVRPSAKMLLVILLVLLIPAIVLVIIDGALAVIVAAYVLLSLVAAIVTFGVLGATAMVKTRTRQIGGSAAIFVIVLGMLLVFVGDGKTDIYGDIYVDNLPPKKATIYLLETELPKIEYSLEEHDQGRFEFKDVPTVGKTVKLKIEIEDCQAFVKTYPFKEGERIKVDIARSDLIRQVRKKSKEKTAAEETVLDLKQKIDVEWGFFESALSFEPYTDPWKSDVRRVRENVPEFARRLSEINEDNLDMRHTIVKYEYAAFGYYLLTPFEQNREALLGYCKNIIDFSEKALDLIKQVDVKAAEGDQISNEDLNYINNDQKRARLNYLIAVALAFKVKANDGTRLKDFGKAWHNLEMNYDTFITENPPKDISTVEWAVAQWKKEEVAL